MNVPSINRLSMFRSATGATQPGNLHGVGYSPGIVRGVSGLDEWMEFGKRVLGPVFEAGKDLFGQLLQSQVVKLKVAAGYRFDGIVNVEGKTMLKGTNPSGFPIYYDPATGVEINATPERLQSERRYDPGTGSWAGAGLIGGGVLLAGLLVFMLMRRK